MTDDDLSSLEELLPQLRPAQRRLLRSLARAIKASDVQCSVTDDSDVVTQNLAEAFGATLAVHHELSSGALTKDKFEQAIARLLTEHGHEVLLAPRGNPGHDLNVDGKRWSLKTQADKSISRDYLHISKFMELGKGQWETEDDLRGLRDQMIEHLSGYDRILSLRCLSEAKRYKEPDRIEYELVEIPIAVLQLAIQGEFEMVHASTQNPKPGYCRVNDDEGQRLFELYFDGGTERKLQIKKLDKRRCRVHATWTLRRTDST